MSFTDNPDRGKSNRTVLAILIVALALVVWFFVLPAMKTAKPANPDPALTADVAPSASPASTPAKAVAGKSAKDATKK